MALQKTCAEIDLKALSHNLAVVEQKTGGTEVIAVVKADAYGHGSVRVARHLLSQGVTRLGVAFPAEAIELRDAGINDPILVFFDRDTLKEYFDFSLTPVVYDYETAQHFSDEARRRNCIYPIHIKIDTGMGRVGMEVRHALSEICRIAELKNIAIEGLMSHFSDADLQDKEFALHQLTSFRTLAGALSEEGVSFGSLHMANSAAVLTVPDAHLDMVRPGIMLYGYGCCEGHLLQPVMSIRSRIILLKKVPSGTSISYGRTFTTRRDSTIATVPVGYADGLNRLLSNRGSVLVNGRRAPIAGRVCMDTVMIDVTDIPGVGYDSEVTLLGQQNGIAVTADHIAELTGTIPYEVLTSVGKRIERVYR